MNAKDDLQYIIIMRCLDQMEQEGVITSQEYARAKKAAQKELNPQSVWRQRWISVDFCSMLCAEKGGMRWQR